MIKHGRDFYQTSSSCLVPIRAEDFYFLGLEEGGQRKKGSEGCPLTGGPWRIGRVEGEWLRTVLESWIIYLLFESLLRNGYFCDILQFLQGGKKMGGGLGISLSFGVQQILSLLVCDLVSTPITESPRSFEHKASYCWRHLPGVGAQTPLRTEERRCRWWAVVRAAARLWWQIQLYSKTTRWSGQARF